MGLPGAGKSTLAKELFRELCRKNKDVLWVSSDLIRETFNDWDFSEEGRLRQARRILDATTNVTTEFTIIDCVAALEEQRKIIAPDFLIWVDTVTESRYADTNSVFQPPENRDFIVRGKNAEVYAEEIAARILASK